MKDFTIPEIDEKILRGEELTSEEKICWLIYQRRRTKMQNGEMILDKLYSVQLYDYYDTRCYDPIRVLGSSHFNGFLIANLRSRLIFNLQNEEGSVVIPFENIRWMVPIKEEEKKEERNWLDDLQP